MDLKSDKNILPYCGELVQKHDPDRFLQTMFMPAGVREDLWALFAFNHEIAKTREVVSDSTLGLIRLQWWRDAIKGIYEDGVYQDHEVIKPLAAAIKKHTLPREHFDQLAYAREFDLEDVSPGNVEGLLNYADFTTQSLFKLALIISGADPDQHVVQPVAINYALAGVLRATASFARQHRFYLPEDLMTTYNVSKEHFFEEQSRENLQSVIKDVLDAKLSVTKPSHPFLRSAEAISELYFKQIKGAGYDILNPKLGIEPPLKVLRVFLRTKIL